MKKLFAIALLASFTTLAAPLQWTCDWPEAKSQTFSLYQGETATFEPTFRVNGRTVTNATIEAVWYQTNGMGNAWWKLDGATFAPSNDVGAAAYRFFVEAKTSDDILYRANGALRMLPSPGFTPNTIELPVARLDFAAVEVANAPWTDPDYSTNNTELVETIEATAPAPGNYAVVSNKAMTALQSFTEADPTVPTWAKSATQPLPPDYANVSNLAVDAVHKRGAETIYGEKTFNDGVRLYEVGGSGNITTLFDYAIIHNDNYIRYPEADGTLALESTVAAAASAATNYTDEAIAEIPVPDFSPSNATLVATIEKTSPAPGDYATVSNRAMSALQSYTESDPTISAWAKAASKPTYTADEVGAVSSNKIEEVRTDNAQTRQIVTTWENFLDGSNVVFSITNYLSGSYNLDAAKLRILELREGAYHEVFNSRDEILLHIENFRTNDFRAATNQLVGAVNEAIGGKADKDWGKYTSAGGDAPANTVYMTAPNTVFAGGLEYERVAVGEGTICVLTTRGAPTWTQGDEGTFKFQDDGGTNYFGFAKTDSYTIGANTDGITVQGCMVTMNYNITMSGRPCVWYKSSLSSGAWEQLNLPDGSPVAGASHAVTWEANPDPGTQVCYINVGNAPSGFFRATVEVTGEAKFMTNMPADMSGGIVCPNTATGVSGVIKPTFNGTTVIWTWSAK